MTPPEEGFMGIPAKTRVTLAGADGGGPRREFCLSRRAAVLLALLFLVMSVAFVMQLVETTISRDQRATVEALERQLADARAEVLAAHAQKAELEQLRRTQQELLVMLGVPRSDSLSAAADTLCDVPPGGAPLSAAPSAPPSRWPAAGAIVREFARGDPSLGVEEHRGVDIAGDAGARVVAAADGDVDFVGTDDILGHHIEIRHGFEYVTIYGHCDGVAVGPGQKVRAGEQIAKIGRSGSAEAPQLHFEVWKHGEAVDPRKILAGEPTPR
jgi:murein DD-endopeptidase MepM/ murein hydrolase activator NlpD